MILIQNGHLVDPASGVDQVADVLIEGKVIKAIGPNLTAPEGARIIDAKDKLVAPGFIDIHVHLRVPGQEYKEDLVTGSAAAVRGGITAVVCMPNTNPVIDNAPIVSYVVAKAKAEALCKVYPTGAITKGSKGQELAEIGEMKEAGIVAITDDGRPVENSEAMRLGMIYAKQFGLCVMDHCEDMSLSAGGAMHDGAVSALLGIKGIPSASEEVHVARDVLLSLETGAHVHIQHISSGKSVELVRWGKRMGSKVTAEATPHHIVLTDEAVAEMNYSTNTKMNPPLRTEADRQAIIAGLLDGTIDIIATDHAPHHIDEKNVEYQDARFGITGLETSVGLVVDRLVKPGLITPAQMVQLMSTRQAEIVGLTPPALVEGAEADITVIDLNRTWTVEVAKMASKSGNTPFGGWELTGMPYATIVSGELRMLEMEVLGK